jgi:hemoglobin
MSDVAAASAPVTEEQIGRLVHRFYGRVRGDDLLGPIFNGQIQDWDHHLGKLTDFWSSVVLRTRRYEGRPMRPHLMLPLEDQHFDRWLQLFEATAHDELPPEAAAVFVQRARMIADSFEFGIGTQRGEMRTPRHSRRAGPGAA